MEEECLQTNKITCFFLRTWSSNMSKNITMLLLSVPTLNTVLICGHKTLLRIANSVTPNSIAEATEESSIINLSFYSKGANLLFLLSQTVVFYLTKCLFCFKYYDLQVTCNTYFSPAKFMITLCSVWKKNCASTDKTLTLTSL